MSNKKDRRGGRRPGAGRPRGRISEGEHITVYLPKGGKEMLRAIAESEGKTMSQVLAKYVESKYRNMKASQKQLSEE